MPVPQIAPPPSTAPAAPQMVRTASGAPARFHDRSLLERGQDSGPTRDPFDAALARARRTPESMAQYVGERLPFVGGAISVKQDFEVLHAANRIKAAKEAGQPPKIPDLDVMAQHFVESDRARERTFWQGFWDIATAIPGFAIEFGATAGAFTLGRKAAEKVVTKGVEQVLGRMGTRVATGLAGAAVQTLANPQMIAANASRRMVDEFGLGRDDAGKLQLILDAEDDGFWDSMPTAVVDAFIEMGSERAGGLLPAIPVPAKMKALKTWVVREWFKKHPDSTIGALSEQIASRAAWNGIIGESFEERVGEVARAVGEKGGLDFNVDPPTLEQIAQEALAFALPGAGRAALTIAEGRLRKTPAPPGDAPVSEGRSGLPGRQDGPRGPSEPIGGPSQFDEPVIEPGPDVVPPEVMDRIINDSRFGEATPNANDVREQSKLAQEGDARGPLRKADLLTEDGARDFAERFPEETRRIVEKGTLGRHDLSKLGIETDTPLFETSQAEGAEDPRERSRFVELLKAVAPESSTQEQPPNVATPAATAEVGRPGGAAEPGGQDAPPAGGFRSPESLRALKAELQAAEDKKNGVEITEIDPFPAETTPAPPPPSGTEAAASTSEAEPAGQAASEIPIEQRLEEVAATLGADVKDNQAFKLLRDELTGASEASVVRRAEVDNDPIAQRALEMARRGGLRRALGGTHGDIPTLLDDAFSTDRQAQSEQQQFWVQFALVEDDQSEVLSKIAGRDVSDHAHALTENVARHIDIEHGPRSGDPNPVTRADIEQLPEIVRTADVIKAGKTKGDGQRAIEYRKRINGWIAVIEVVAAKGRKRLDVRTMYKIGSGPASATSFTSETGRGSAEASAMQESEAGPKGSIPEPAAENKPGGSADAAETESEDTGTSPEAAGEPIGEPGAAEARPTEVAGFRVGDFVTIEGKSAPRVVSSLLPARNQVGGHEPGKKLPPAVILHGRGGFLDASEASRSLTKITKQQFDEIVERRVAERHAEMSPVRSGLENVDLFAHKGSEAETKKVAQKMRDIVKRKQTRTNPKKPLPVTTPSAVPRQLKPDDAAGRIKALNVAVAKETSRYAINGIFADNDGKRIVATDGRRMWFQDGEFGLDNGIHIVNKSGQTTPLLGPDHTFPRYQDIIPSDRSANQTFEVEVEPLVRALRQAAVLTAEDSRGVGLVLNSDGTVGVAVSTPEVGTAAINVSDNHLWLGGYNPFYLIEQLRWHFTNGDRTVRVQWSEPHNPIKTIGERGRTTGVMMPISLPESTARDAIAATEPAESAAAAKISAETPESAQGTDDATTVAGPAAFAVRAVPDLTATLDPKKTPPISNHDIIAGMERIFGVPMRVGRVGNPNAAGVYKSFGRGAAPRVIRFKRDFAGDLAVAAHETAHHIDRVHRKLTDGRGILGETKNLPADARSELKALDYEPEKERAHEGFAEYIRHLLTEDDASEVAPRFHAWFAEWRKAHPEWSDKLDRTRVLIDRWKRQGALNRNIVNIRQVGQQASKPAGVSVREWVGERVSLAMHRFYKTWKDDAHFAHLFDLDVAAAGNKTEDKVGRRLWQITMAFSQSGPTHARTALQRGPHLVSEGEFGKRVGPALYDVLGEVGPKDRHREQLEDQDRPNTEVLRVVRDSDRQGRSLPELQAEHDEE